MTLKEILRIIRTEGIKQIAVTGPQRSGTGIGSYILANELKTTLIHERAFNGNDYKGFLKHISLHKKFIVHCPGLMHCAERFPDNMLVVVITRPLNEIMASERRIDWDDSDERIPYDDRKSFDMSSPISYIKYQFADRVLSRTRRLEYLDYNSLSWHKLFIPKHKRRGFLSHQLSVKVKTPPITIDFGKDGKK